MPDPLYAELSRDLGSAQEARWVLEDLALIEGTERAAAASAIVERRRRGEPLQYLLGHWSFRGLDLGVDARALIPRPETEGLVERALAVLGARAGHLCAADLGTGSGAIACSLSVEAAGMGVDLDVIATDVDPGALDLAAENVRRVGARRVELRAGDWFDALPAHLEGRLDLVCSNPPYVSRAARAQLARELDYEPDIALVAHDGAGGAAGMAGVDAVLGGARRWLAPGGTVLVEHGDDQRDAAVDSARRAGLVDVVDHDDLAGRPRVLEARRGA